MSGYNGICGVEIEYVLYKWFFVFVFGDDIGDLNDGIVLGFGENIFVISVFDIEWENLERGYFRLFFRGFMWN